MFIISDFIRKIASKMKPEIDELVFEFIKKNNNPSDAQVHAFAEKEDISVHDIEKAIYKLATMFVRLKTEGLAMKKGITVKDVDPKELKKGIKIEKEHTNDDEIAEKIALDHLAEIKNYYTLLEKMEKESELS